MLSRTNFPAGLFWWKWDQQVVKVKPEHYNEDPARDRGFTIYGKPAAEIMREWCKKTN